MRLPQQLITLLCFIFTEVLIGSFFYHQFSSFENETKASILNHTYKDYQNVLKSYESVAQTVYSGLVNVSEVLNVVKEAYTHKDRQIDRDKIYEHLSPVYKSLSQNGILQFHIHFPDGTSFLRMHAPQKHSDQIFDKRFSLRQVLKEKKYISGFEEGHYVDGYRNVFPLILENEYIGSVEIDISMVAISRMVENLYDNYSHFTLKKEIADHIAYSDWFKKNYKECLLSENFVVPVDPQSMSFSGSSIIGEINQKLKSRMKGRLENFDQMFEVIDHGGDEYIVTFIPVRNIEGQEIAYIITYKKDSILSEHRWMILKGFMLTTFFASIVFIFLYRLQLSQSKLQIKNKILEEQTKELKEGEGKFRNFFEQAGDYALVFEMDNYNPETAIVVDANQAALDEHGYSYDEIIGQSLGLIDPNIKPFPDEIRKKLMDGERIFFEATHTRKDGSTFPVEVCSKQISYGGKNYYYTIERNITERKNNELVLKESEELYRSLVESTTAIAWEVDLESLQFLYISPKVEELLGYPVEMWKDFDFWASRIFPEDKEEALSYCQQETAKGKDHEFEYRFYSANGDVVWIKDIVSVIRKADTPVKLRGYFLDITASKYLEKESQKIKNLEAVGTLAGGIAHDFNNLLTVIFGNIELATLDIDSKSKSAKYLFNSKNALEKAKELTSQLLTFAKGGDPIKQKTSLKDLVLYTVTTTLSGSNIQFLFDIPDDLWEVSVDKGQINQVIKNLVVNASDAMPNGGTLNLSAVNFVQDKSSRAIKRGKYVRLRVQDEGKGVQENIIDKIFDPYFSTKKKGEIKGTGMGLAICHSIMSKHHGHIDVESSSEGATFLLFIPVIDSLLEVPSIRISQEKILEPSLLGRILVLEDDLLVSEVLEMMLIKIGYSPEFTTKGEDTVEKYDEAFNTDNPFKIVLLDLTIKGGMGGEETIKKLLEIDPEVKGVVASGYADDPIMSNCLSYGFMAAIPKPCTIDSLTKTLGSLSKSDSI